MKRSFAVVRVGLVLALAQACSPSRVPASAHSFAVRAVVDLEAGTQVSRIGVYALLLAPDDSVRSSWGKETEATPDGPYAAPVDSWPELDVQRGDRVHVTVVAYGPSDTQHTETVAARHAMLVVGDRQWLRTKLDWLDFGNATDHAPERVLDVAAAVLSFDPRQRFTGASTENPPASPLEGTQLPAEQCVDVQPCLVGTPPEPTCDADGCETSFIDLADGTLSVQPLVNDDCALQLPAQAPVTSTPVVFLRDVVLGEPALGLRASVVAQLGRDYKVVDRSLWLSSELCTKLTSGTSSRSVSVACHVTENEAPSVCRDSAIRRQPRQQGSHFVLPRQPVTQLSDIALAAPPTFFAVGEGRPLLFAIGNSHQLVLRRAHRYYEGFSWGAPVLTDFAGEFQIRAVHAVGAPSYGEAAVEPRVFVAGTDGALHAFDGTSWNPRVSFCENDAECTTQADVVGVVSATVRHGALWVLRAGAELAVYRESAPERAERVPFAALGAVTQVLEPIDHGAGLALIVQRVSGAWELVLLDPASSTPVVLPIESDRPLLHLVQSGADFRSGTFESPHVLSDAGESSLAIGPDSATLVPLRVADSAGASWYGRGSPTWYEQGLRESCSLHDARLRCWRPDQEEQVLDGVFAARFFDEYRGSVVVAGAPGTYTLDLRYFGPTFP